MCGPKFCSMKITQDLRKEALELEAQDLEAQVGMEAKSREFLEQGGTLYIPVE